MMLYQYASRENLPSDHIGLGLPEGYFALPPNHSAAPPDTSPFESEDVPPPYTASQADLHALAVSHAPDSTVQAQAEHYDREEGDEEGDEEGILSFSTQSRQSGPDASRSGLGDDGLRRRREEGSPAVETSEETSAPSKKGFNYIRVRLFVVLYLLHPLRLLAAVPGCIGTFWLLRNAVVILWYHKSIWQQQSNTPSAMEFGLASLWSLATAYHAMSFTTLLLRRWVHYYSILSSFIRLIALQAICWPLVRLTLYILGPKNPLAGWVIISTTTAFSDTVARWVVSNISNDLQSPVSEREASHLSNNRKRRKRRSGATAFWRAVMGGPPSDSNVAAAASASSQHTNQPNSTEGEADSDADVYRYRLNERQFERYMSGGAGRREDSSATASRRLARCFHWDVAIRRNALPIAVLSFISLLNVLLEQVHQRQ